MGPLDDIGRLNRRALAGLIGAIVLIVDQATKIWAVAALEGSPLTLIDGVLRLAVARNPGASFSTFTNAGQLIGLIAAGVVVVVMVLVERVPYKVDIVGLALIMGGAAGNLTDRIFRGGGFLDGAVVDFIDFDFFPSFNVADTAINVGVGLLLLGTFVMHRHHGKTPAEDDPDQTDAGARESAAGTDA